MLCQPVSNVAVLRCDRSHLIIYELPFCLLDKALYYITSHVSCKHTGQNLYGPSSHSKVLLCCYCSSSCGSRILADSMQPAPFAAPVEFCSMVCWEKVTFSIDFHESISCWQLAFSCQTVKLPPPKWLISQIHLGFYL